MKKKNILISESQFDNLLELIMNMITGGNLGSYGKSSLSSSDYKDMLDKIIDAFEGGYYDPSTMSNSKMGNSGETMYGMDKEASGMMQTSDGQEFWKIVHEDKEKNPSCWKYNYDPAKGKGDCYNPELSKKLKNVILKIMVPEFENLKKRFLTPELNEIIDKNKSLKFNFFYCTWNGSGYFQDFSKAFKKSYDNGITDPQALSGIMLDFRKDYDLRSSFANNLIRKGGREMEKVVQGMS